MDCAHPTTQELFCLQKNELSAYAVFRLYPKKLNICREIIGKSHNTRRLSVGVESEWCILVIDLKQLKCPEEMGQTEPQVGKLLKGEEGIGCWHLTHVLQRVKQEAELDYCLLYI